MMHSTLYLILDTVRLGFFFKTKMKVTIVVFISKCESNCRHRSDCHCVVHSCQIFKFPL